MVGTILFLEILFFAACALWREWFFLKKKKFIVERILLILVTIFYLIMKFLLTENVIVNFNHHQSIESGLLGLIYVLNFNLLVGLIMRTSNSQEKTIRTQKRLMYKLPLVGFLLGITFYNYIGPKSISIFLIFLLAIYLVCHYVFFKQIVVDKYILIFVLLNVIALGVRFWETISFSIDFSIISNGLMAFSILMILESFHQRLKNYA